MIRICCPLVTQGSSAFAALADLTISQQQITQVCAGEWCTSPGIYQQLGHPNRTQFTAIQAANSGPYCSSLDSVSCVRNRKTLQSEVTQIAAAAALAPASAPSSSQNGQTAPGTAYLIANPPIATAGRRMKTTNPLAM